MPRTSVQSLAFEQFPFFLKFFQLRVQFAFNLASGVRDSVFRKDVVFGRINIDIVEPLDFFACERVDDRQFFDFVAPQFNPVGEFFVGRPDFNDIAANAEVASRGCNIVSRVLNIAEFPEQVVAINRSTNADGDHHLEVIFGRAQAVDATDAGHDDDIATADQGTGCQQPQPVDFFIDRRIFFDVNVALRNVGFGLIVVVIADEIGNGIVREEVPEFAVELRRQSFVM